MLLGVRTVLVAQDWGAELGFQPAACALRAARGVRPPPEQKLDELSRWPLAVFLGLWANMQRRHLQKNQWVPNSNRELHGVSSHSVPLA